MKRKVVDSPFLYFTLTTCNAIIYPLLISTDLLSSTTYRRNTSLWAILMSEERRVRGHVIKSAPFLTQNSWKEGGEGEGGRSVVCIFSEMCI